MENLNQKRDCPATEETAVEQVLTHLDNIICNYTDLRKANDESSLGMYNIVIQEGRQLANAYGASTVSLLKSLIDEWSDIYSEDADSRNKAFCELSEKFVGYYKFILKDKEQHSRDGHLFNVFTLFSQYVEIRETLHSRLLHFLLSDGELHGQKNKFLLEFLKMTGIDNPEDGVWEITAETGHVDVMLQRHCPHSVILIENKSNGAADQANQLYRYWYKYIHRHAEDFSAKYYEENNRYRIIYLAPNENKSYSDQTCCKPPRNHEIFNSDEDFNAAPDRVPLQPVVWTFNRQLQEWLNRCMEILDVDNHPVREYIRQYKEYCQTL